MEDILDGASSSSMMVEQQPSTKRVKTDNSNSLTSSSSSSERSSSNHPPIGPENEEEVQLIQRMANSGVPTRPWRDVLQPMLERYIFRTLDAFREKAEKQSVTDEVYLSRKEEIHELITGFYGVPFTLQRICELILNPNAHYKSLDALLRGFEMLLSVSSTIPVVSEDEVERLKSEYERVVSTEMPGRSPGGHALRRSDTVEMDMDMS